MVLATWWTVGSIEATARSDRERVLRQLIAASEAAEAAHNPGAAFREIEAAVTQARKIDPDGSTRLDALIRRRDQADRAEVEARLATLDKLAVDQRVGEALILADRSKRDPALAPLGEAIMAKVEEATARQAEADRDRARVALNEGRGVEAFRLAARSHDRAGRLANRPDADRLQGEAKALIVAAVERSGVLMPVGAEPKSGTIDAFILPIWAEALANRGYLPPPKGTPWGEVWTSHAPYSASSKLDESTEGLYLQSKNRMTRIDGQFALTLRGQTHWQTRIFAQTRAPLPDLPAYVSGRLATADHRDADTERRLRDDARAAFRIQADRNFRGIPPPAAPPESGSAPSRSSRSMAVPKTGQIGDH